MSILELLSAVSSVVITEADAEAIKEKITKAEDGFELESRSSSIDDTFLSRTYSL
ncbi:hypothetical protein [Enterobacter asburiae]|uniref:hypothetical protein n=1 Tax=Enterobacter asburiae TaxID=61645 RepID=UPI0034CDB064